ncbi:hypothetical protein LOK49_LG06G01464 [Camellia lanceoleosa]|uniref:Uncharacterized protein n=1 Tax=Camellia lanceoleosa TaxID=1840588 RepID=A0ACC0HAD4_9ERIC|nr:hypothetical protein LOK49_LG06G01464 [Camellia lanceoleosa]
MLCYQLFLYLFLTAVTFMLFAKLSGCILLYYLSACYYDSICYTVLCLLLLWSLRCLGVLPALAVANSCYPRYLLPLFCVVVAGEVNGYGTEVETRKVALERENQLERWETAQWGAGVLCQVGTDVLRRRRRSTPQPETTVEAAAIDLVKVFLCPICRQIHHALGDGISLMSVLLACCRRANDPDRRRTFESVGASKEMGESERWKRVVERGVKTREAAEIDDILMGPLGFSVDLLIELASLSVATAIAEVYRSTEHICVLAICGPGNNGVRVIELEL